MRAACYLAMRSLVYRWRTTLLVALGIGVVLAIPLVARVLVDQFDTRLTARSDAVPLVIGGKGSRYELILASLYHRGAPEGDIALAEYDRLLDDRIRAIPLRLGSSAQRVPIVGTSVELFEHRGLTIIQGRRFALPGECVLGSKAAAMLGLGLGDTITTDLQRGYDVTTAPAIELVVAGVLDPTDSPDDNAVFVDLETCWIIEGFAHGHDAPEAIGDDAAVLARTDNAVVLAPGVQTRQSVSADDLESFHLHGDREELPLSAILVFPSTDRERTILASRFNATPTASAVVPGTVIDEMLEHVVRVRQMLDVTTLVTAITTYTLIALIVSLGLQLRKDELVMLDQIGAPTGLVRQMLAMELLGQIVLAAVLGGLIVGAVALASDALTGAMLSVFG